MNIYEKLSAIQNELKAPKNQRNSFGNYNYRNAEDILEAVKPLCAKHNATLVLTDEIAMIGERYYVKAIANLIDNETCDVITTSAYAREEESKKGMDASQVTGSCSSYARKYCMNGLFNIDDTKDADTDEQHEVVSNAKKKEFKAKKEDIKANDPTISSDKVEIAIATINGKQTTVEAVCKAYGIAEIKDITETQYDNLMKRLSKTPDKENE